MTESIFKDMTLSILRDNYKVYSLGDDFLLSDNLTTDQNIGEISIPTPGYPYRIDFLLILVCLEGSMTFNIDVMPAKAGKNDVIVALPGSIGSIVNLSADCKMLVFGIGDAGIINAPTSSYNTAFLKLLRKNPVMHMTDIESEQIQSLYNIMREKLEDKDFRFKQEFLKSLMQALVYVGYNWLEKNGEAKEEKTIGTRAEQLFAQFMDVVRENYQKERGMKFYADRLFVTPKYLSQVVHEVSGKFATDWIRDFVITDAKALLRSRRSSIQQVAYQLGFENASFFGKYFKAATGLSPRAYMLLP